MRTLGIVQVRTASTRLPGKALKTVHGRSLIEVMLTRLKACREIDEIVVATTDQPADDQLAALVRNLGLSVVRGSENDVLSRFLLALENTSATEVVRLTGDCPLIDPALVDDVVRLRRKSNVDYASNIAPPTFPDGLDVEVATVEAFRRSALAAFSPAEREHVTIHLRESGLFSTANLSCQANEAEHRWTVDTPADLVVVTNVLEYFHPRLDFSWTDVLALVESKPALFVPNQAQIRNEGATRGSGQKLWDRAKKVIPGGNMLLSKRAEMILPDLWPAYFKRARGCEVWDLDDRHLVDVSLMGVGTNTLGYGHPEVDAAVSSAIAMGNMSTLNCPEEVAAAERLCELHPFADMVRFCRTGGEANAVAVRIARAAAGKDKVAICGYHGWHDWYLAANLGDAEGLDGHLLPGLEPRGVPRNLKGSVLPFNYNDFETLATLVASHSIGVIKMEVSRNKGPEDGFLQKVRDLADQNGIVLVFDECTSGFRETFGGLHKKFGVEPDIAIFGKALGNGYALTAVAGRRPVMEAAQTTFISSTFWTERIGSMAAMKTLDIMEQEKSWVEISRIGRKVKEAWMSLAKTHGLPLETAGLDPLASFDLRLDNELAVKTLFTQEMLDRGYLANDNFYASIAHDDLVLERYFNTLDDVFALLKTALDEGSVEVRLRGPVRHARFKRLN